MHKLSIYLAKAALVLTVIIITIQCAKAADYILGNQ